MGLSIFSILIVTVFTEWRARYYFKVLSIFADEETGHWDLKKLAHFSHYPLTFSTKTSGNAGPVYWECTIPRLWFQLLWHFPKRVQPPGVSLVMLWGRSNHFFWGGGYHFLQASHQRFEVNNTWFEVNSIWSEVEEELKAQIEMWEQKHTTVFLVNGQKFVEYVTEQWEMHRLEKEWAKQVRVRELSLGRGKGGHVSNPDLLSLGMCHCCFWLSHTNWRTRSIRDRDAVWQYSQDTQEAVRNDSHHTGQSAQGKEAPWPTSDEGVWRAGPGPSLAICPAEIVLQGWRRVFGDFPLSPFEIGALFLFSYSYFTIYKNHFKSTCTIIPRRLLKLFGVFLAFLKK